MALTQEQIDKYRRLYKESTNETVKATAKTKLEEAGETLTETKKKETAKKETQKAEPKKADKKRPAKMEKKKKDANCDELLAREKEAEQGGYDIDEMLKSVRERKAKAKAKAKAKKNEPKKTPATKNKEVIEKSSKRVAENVEKRVKEGKVTSVEIQKLIDEHKDAIKKLEKLLEKAKAKKLARGGSLNGRNKPKMVRTQFEEESFEYARGGKTKKHEVEHDEDLDKNYVAKKSGLRVSEKFAHVPMKGGGSYTRRNANQFGKVKGNKYYTENRPEHADVRKWI
jgi:hypothetical protein